MSSGTCGAQQSPAEAQGVLNFDPIERGLPANPRMSNADRCRPRIAAGGIIWEKNRPLKTIRVANPRERYDGRCVYNDIAIEMIAGQRSRFHIIMGPSSDHRSSSGGPRFVVSVELSVSWPSRYDGVDADPDVIPPARHQRTSRDRHYYCATMSRGCTDSVARTMTRRREEVDRSP
jgi:hypothetical protein